MERVQELSRSYVVLGGHFLDVADLDWLVGD